MCSSRVCPGRFQTVFDLLKKNKLNDSFILVSVVIHSLCVRESAASSSHLVLVVVVIPQSLTVLVQFAHEHLPRAKVEGAEVHLVTKVTCQLGLASKLLPRWTDK